MNIGLKTELNFLSPFNVKKTNTSWTFSVKMDVISVASGSLWNYLLPTKYTLGFSFHVVPLWLVLDNVKI